MLLQYVGELAITQPVLNSQLSVLLLQYEGELAVREEFPEAIVFRPADIYGSEDRFLRYYANFCE